MLGPFVAGADGVAEADGLVSPASAGGEFLFGGVAGKGSELEDDGEDHGGCAGTGGDHVVALAPFLLLPPQLALGFHLLDAPFGFAGTA